MKNLLATLILALPITATAAAVPLKGQPEKGSVNFLAVGRPSMLKVHGQAPGPESKLKFDAGAITGTLEFALEKLDTGIDLRNQHMKEKYLQVKEFPQAKLTLTKAPVEGGFEKTLRSGENEFRGQLSLHGKEKEVQGTFSVNDGKLRAKFPLKLTDFAIEVPKYLGVTIADNVDVDVELPLTKE